MQTNDRRANFLPELRKKRGLSQKKLADLIGANLTTINRYENGSRGMSRETISQLANALGVKNHELFTQPKG